MTSGFQKRSGIGQGRKLLERGRHILLRIAPFDAPGLIDDLGGEEGRSVVVEKDVEVVKEGVDLGSEGAGNVHVSQ